jgi:hypothetical protein
MMRSSDVLVLGTGLAGASLIDALSVSDLRVSAIDKARGLGGRLSSRRVRTGSSLGETSQEVSFDLGPGNLRVASCGTAQSTDTSPGPRYGSLGEALLQARGHARTVVRSRFSGQGEIIEFGSSVGHSWFPKELATSVSAEAGTLSLGCRVSRISAAGCIDLHGEGVSSESGAAGFRVEHSLGASTASVVSISFPAPQVLAVLDDRLLMEPCVDFPSLTVGEFLRSFDGHYQSLWLGLFLSPEVSWPFFRSKLDPGSSGDESSDSGFPFWSCFSPLEGITIEVSPDSSPSDFERLRVRLLVTDSFPTMPQGLLGLDEGRLFSSRVLSQLRASVGWEGFPDLELLSEHFWRYSQARGPWPVNGTVRRLSVELVPGLFWIGDFASEGFGAETAFLSGREAGQRILNQRRSR